MTRKLIVYLLTATLLQSGFLAEAQPTAKVRRIGILRSGSPSFYVSQHEAVRQALRELEYMEGKNLLIEYRYAESKLERLPDLARKLVERKVEVLVVSPSAATIRAAMGATSKIPIVMMGATIDPVEAGFVESLRRPGGNLTGLINPRPELDPKRLQLLKETFPPISRVAIIWTLRQQKLVMEEVVTTGQALGVSIQPLVVDNRVGLASLESALSAISRESPDALLVPSIRTTLHHRSRIVDFAAEKRLPAMYATARFVGQGGLMSYDASEQDMLRRVAAYVDKLLKGANAAELPIEQPTKFELVINLKTAKQLGVNIPPTMLYRANKIIK